MFGLILAAIYVAYNVLVSNAEPLSAFENTLGFLWTWHIIFAASKAIIWLIVPVVGAIFGVVGDSNEKIAGVTAVVLSPLLLFAMSITSILFLSGVYALDSGIQNGEIVNQNHVILGAILYFLGVLFNIGNRSSSTKKQD